MFSSGSSRKRSQVHGYKIGQTVFASPLNSTHLTHPLLTAYKLLHDTEVMAHLGQALGQMENSVQTVMRGEVEALAWDGMVGAWRAAARYAGLMPSLSMKDH